MCKRFKIFTFFILFKKDYKKIRIDGKNNKNLKKIYLRIVGETNLCIKTSKGILKMGYLFIFGWS